MILNETNSKLYLTIFSKGLLLSFLIFKAYRSDPSTWEAMMCKLLYEYSNPPHMKGNQMVKERNGCLFSAKLFSIMSTSFPLKFKVLNNFCQSSQSIERFLNISFVFHQLSSNSEIGYLNLVIMLISAKHSDSKLLSYILWMD